MEDVAHRMLPETLPKSILCSVNIIRRQVIERVHMGSNALLNESNLKDVFHSVRKEKVPVLSDVPPFDATPLVEVDLRMV